MSSSQANSVENLTTQDLCVLLGLDYQELMGLYHRHQHSIPIIKQGGRLVWTPDAVAAIRPLVDERRRKALVRQTEESHHYHMGIVQLGNAAKELLQLARSLLSLHKSLVANPPTATCVITSLPDRDLQIPKPISALISPVSGKRWMACLADAPIEAEGRSRQAAVSALRLKLVRVYYEHKEDPARNPDLWLDLQQLIAENSTSSSERH